MQRPYDTGLEGTVLNLQRFSIHDGPGIRTVVFLKGCSLRCRWCSNPESMAKARQLGVFAAKCIGIDKCGACLERAAGRETLVVEDNHVVGVVAGREVDSLATAELCPAGALKVWGEVQTIGAVMQEVLADRGFYAESGGGMTLSGGEALVQARFAIELLKAAKAEGVGTCIETALNYDPVVLDGVLPYLDFALCDLKHMDPAAHERFTGVSNRRVLANLEKVVGSGIPVVIRIPVVPGHNGTEENLRATAVFIRSELGGAVRQVQLLPFRKLGEEKYASLRLRYPMQDFVAPPREQWEPEIRRLAAMMCDCGVPAVAGSDHKLAA
jgi:glycyl-radical enzyme activating protein